MHSFKPLGFNQRLVTIRPATIITNENPPIANENPPIKKVLLSGVSKIAEGALRFFTEEFVKMLIEAVETHCFCEKTKKIIRLAFHNDFIAQYKRSELMLKVVEQFGEGDEIYTFRGYMNFKDNIDAAVKILVYLLTTDMNVALDAPTQCGKTSILIIAANLYVLVKASEGTLGETVIKLVPYHEVNAYDDMDADNKAFHEIYGNIHMEGSERLLLRSVIDADSLIVKRRDLMVMLADAIRDGQKEIALFVDEADHGSAVDSLFENFLKKLKSHNSRTDTPTIKLRLVALSATPYEFKDLESTFRYVQVTKSKGSGYKGICQGDQIAIAGFSDLAAAFNLNNLSGMEKVDLDDKVIMVDMVQLVKKLADGVNARQFGLNGLPFNGGNAMAIRLGGNCPKAFKAALRRLKSLKFVERNLVEKGEESHNDEIMIIDYFEKGLRIKGKAAKLEHLIADKSKKYIILLKGAGRRAARFPKSCAVFLDFTNNYTHGESFYQGLIGRATGYKDDNIFVCVTDNNNEDVKETREHFAKTGEDLPSKGFKRAVAEYNPYAIKKDHYKDRISLTDDSLPTEIRDLIKSRLKNQVVPHLRYNRKEVIDKKGNKRIMTKLSQKGRHKYDFINLLGDEEGINEIERVLSIKFKTPIKCLRPGQILNHNGNLKMYPIDDGNPKRGKIAVADDKRATGGNDASNRDTRRQSVKGQLSMTGNVNLEFSFNEEGGEFEPMSFVLWFAHKVVAADSPRNPNVNGKTILLPTEKSQFCGYDY